MGKICARKCDNRSLAPPGGCSRRTGSRRRCSESEKQNGNGNEICSLEL